MEPTRNDAGAEPVAGERVDAEGLFARLDEKGFSYTDVTEDESVAEFIL